MAIDSWAECDNCGYHVKLVDREAPIGWGVFNWTYSGGSGLDATRSSRQMLLCSDCRETTKRALDGVMNRRQNVAA